MSNSTSPSVNNVLTQSFGDTKEGKWLAQNALEYRFPFLGIYKNHFLGIIT
jgi:LAS superfamily LD-carboxypeptidase LdcB